MRPYSAIAPGYWADLVVFDDFKNFNIKKVLRSGEVVAEDYVFVAKAKSQKKLKIRGSVNVGAFEIESLKVKDEKSSIRVIEMVPGQIITKTKIFKPEKISDDGHILSDTENDILKIAVIERHEASGNIGVGFVKGFGFKKGAIASTVCHDSHNIIVVGTNDEDMKLAVDELVKSQGGKVVVDGKVRALLSLPVAGLMSKKPLYEAAREKLAVENACKDLGVRITAPFMALSFLALPVIPELKITDMGLVDVNKFDFVPLSLK